MLSLSQTILFYKRQDVQNAIADASEGKEIAVKYGDKGFGKRPDVIKFPNDVMEFALKGATSFHASEELWTNPLSIKTGMSEKEKEDIRQGWDLVIDIDCHVLDYSRMAAELIIEALKYHNLNAISCKFSGNKGFHIGVPFESFPSQIHDKETRLLFPEAPKKIALYIKNMINKPLGKRILDYEDGDFSKIIENTGFSEDEIKYMENDENGIPVERLDASKIADIDTLLISSRHLYRMPYSFNEKSGLVSIPLKIEELSNFTKKMAKPENVKVDPDIVFLDKTKCRYNEAHELMIQAYDFQSEEEIRNVEQEYYEDNIKKEFEKKEFSAPEMAVDRKFFPPCINNAMKGMEDGKKRALFAMINFLKCLSWDKDQAESFLHEWNESHVEPLRETIIKGQLRYGYMKKDNILPPNCMRYYQEIGICQPDNLCRKIKNPVNYAIRKSRYSNQQENDVKSKSKTENSKEKSSDSNSKRN
ncbi:MAG: DNA primase small subunit domain-containing protein [Candidatus Woesearchaeota archaeon]